MPVITINGPIGSSTVEVGRLVSEQLGLNYVDRQVLAQAARLVSSPVAALVEREQRVVRFRDRLSRLLQTMLEQEPYAGLDFGLAVESLPAESYLDLSHRSRHVDDRAFIEATGAVMKDLASAGDVVIIGRGSNMILGEMEGVFHVGLLAPLEQRVETIVRREHLSGEEAARYVADSEKARVDLFRKFYRGHPNDPGSYHLMLNQTEMSEGTAASIIACACG